MMRSLYSGVSGLRVHQTKMDVIGNNIANVNTVAYKSQSVTFSEVFYQTTQSASGPNAATGTGGQNAMQIGLGSSVGSISTAIETEGAAQRTDNPFDLKLKGNAFFVVNSGDATYFTRAGDFTVDASGALVTTSGASVMGWQVDDDGNVVKDQVSPLYVKSADFTYTDPESTTSATVTGNVNPSDANFTNSTGGVAFTYNFFDSLGYSYKANMKLSNPTLSADKSATTYTVSLSGVTREGEKTDLGATITPATITFNALTGKIQTTDADGKVCQLEIAFTDGNTVDGATVEANTETIGTMTSGKGDGKITLDLTGLTSIADETSFDGGTLGIKTGTTTTGAGKAVGKMTSVGIDTSGGIIANYSNGDVKTIGQIAVTTFSNPAGLEKVGDNMYQATLNSGLFDGIGEDVSTSGSISSGTLEMSNVDLSAQFTEMITTQRGFQANSRIITVSDTMIEELVNLKR